MGPKTSILLNHEVGDWIDCMMEDLSRNFGFGTPGHLHNHTGMGGDMEGLVNVGDGDLFEIV